jgi:hypothetical protein
MITSPNKQEGFDFSKLLCPISRLLMDIEIGNIIEKISMVNQTDDKNELENLHSLLNDIESDPCLSLRQKELVEEWKCIISKKISQAKRIAAFRSNHQ